MNDFRTTITKYNLKPYKYKYINKACVIYTDHGNYVMKRKRRSDKDKLYDYLLAKNFSFFLYPENDLSDEHELYTYIDEVELSQDEKAKDLMLILSEMHNRTTAYKNINLDKIKEIYEDKLNTIDYLAKYYNDLEEVFMMHIYNSPEEYLLLKNMDKISNTLQYSKLILEEWYNNITKTKKERTTLIHNHLSLDHFIDGRDAKLINFDYAEYNSPIYDFVYFYKKHYKELDMESLYKIYRHKFMLTKEEELLLFVELMLPWKVVFSRNHYNNSVEVYNLNKYLDVTRNFILKEQEKYQKGNETNKA